MQSLRTAFACLLLSVVVAAQGATPAPELRRLADRVGNWRGEGTMTEPGNVVTRWTSRSTASWILDGHWLMEDLLLEFEGLPTPYAQRSWLGWDRGDKSYVRIAATNGGRAQRQRVALGGDGTLTVLALQSQGGMPYAERIVQTKDGDAYTHEVELLMPRGSSLATVKGRFTKGGDGCASSLDAPAFLGATPDEQLAKLARSAGEYDVKGAMPAGPGETMRLVGVETFRSAFGGMALFGTTEGGVEGMPGVAFAGHVLWAHDPATGGLVAHYLGSGGEVMTLAATWLADGQLWSSFAGPFQGKQAMQRSLMRFDADGGVVSAVSHAMTDADAPAESHRATYTRRKK